MQKEFVKLSVNDIHPYPNNPRINGEAVAYVVESMNQTGNLDPIEVDENNVILSGHTRLLALEQLGITETECVRYTGLTEEQKRKYRILANRTGEVASWDEELLSMELGDLDFGDFDFGIKNEETDWFSAIEDDTFSDRHSEEIDVFGITLTFPKSREDEVKKFIKETGKEALSEKIMEMMDNASMR